MDSDATKLIQARFDELPEDVQRAIQSANVDTTLQTIGQKHHLHIDQMERLDDETRMVMLGFTEPGAFADQIGVEVKVSPEEADVIAAEISNALLVPIRESMQKFMDERVLQAQLTRADKLTGASDTPPPAEKPSVVMPSSMSMQPAPMPKPVAPAPVPAPAPMPKPAVDMHAADVMLSQPTVSLPKPPAPPAAAPRPIAPTVPVPASTPKVEIPPSTSSGQANPSTYKADPYREPPE